MNTPSSSTALQDLPTTIKPAALLPLREAGAGDSYHVYLGQAYGRAHIPSIGFPTRRLRKVILRDICGCNFYLAAAALIIGIVTFVAGLFSIQLQQWTSLKDYLEYCQAEVANLSGEARLDCEGAIRRGLDPPPHTSAGSKDFKFFDNMRRSLDVLISQVSNIQSRQLKPNIRGNSRTVAVGWSHPPSRLETIVPAFLLYSLPGTLVFCVWFKFYASLLVRCQVSTQRTSPKTSKSLLMLETYGMPMFLTSVYSLLPAALIYRYFNQLGQEMKLALVEHSIHHSQPCTLDSLFLNWMRCHRRYDHLVGPTSQMEAWGVALGALTLLASLVAAIPVLQTYTRLHQNEVNQAYCDSALLEASNLELSEMKRLRDVDKRSRRRQSTR